MKSVIVPRVAFSLLALTLVQSASATNYAFTNAAGGEASDSANWADASVPAANDAAATLDFTKLSADATATFSDAYYTWKDFLLGNGTITGGAVSLTDGLKATVKNGESTISQQLYGGNAYYVHGATVRLATVQTNDVVVGVQNGRLVLDGALTSASSLRIDGNGTIAVAANQTVATLQGNCKGGRIEIAADRTLTVTGGGESTNTTFAGSVVGVGTLAKQGAGYNLVLTSDNTTNNPFAGTLDVQAGKVTLSDGRSYSKTLTPTLYWSFDDPYSPGKADVGSVNLSACTWSSASGHVASDANISAPGVNGAGIHPNGSVFMGANQGSAPRGNAAFSVLCWAKVDAAADGRVQLLGFGDRTVTYTQFAMCIEPSGGISVFNSYQISAEHRIVNIGDVNCKDGRWHFVGVTFDGSTIKVYVDGELAGSNETTFNMKDGWAYLDLGVLGIGNSGERTVCDISLDEVAVYNGTVLSAEQMSACKASFSAVVETAATVPPLPDPVAWYRFDDASNVGKDSSGNGYDLTGVGYQDNANRVPKVASGSPICGSMYSAPGHGCLRWGGSSGATLPAKIPSGTSPVSASLWVNMGSSAPRITTSTQYDVTVFQIGTDSASHRIGVSGNDASLRFSFMTSRKSPRISGIDLYVTKEVATGWHHVAYVSDGSSVSLYVDGRLQGTWNGSVTIASDGTFAIGAGISSSNDAFNQGTQLFKGNLDEVKIYDSALTAAQVMTDYRRELPRTGNVVGAEASVSLASGATLAIDGSAQTLSAVPTGTGLIHLKHCAALAIVPSADSILSANVNGCGKLCIAGGRAVTLAGELGPGVAVAVTNAALVANEIAGSLDVESGALLKMGCTLTVGGTAVIHPGFVVDATIETSGWQTLISAKEIVADGVDLSLVEFRNAGGRRGMLKIEGGALKAKFEKGFTLIYR